MCKPCKLFIAAVPLPMFSTPRRLNESMCVLVIGRGAGETWFVSHSLAEKQRCTASLSLYISPLPSFFPPPFSHLISALPSKRQGADSPTVQAKNSHQSQFNVPYSTVGHRWILYCRLLWLVGSLNIILYRGCLFLFSVFTFMSKVLSSLFRTIYFGAEQELQWKPFSVSFTLTVPYWENVSVDAFTPLAPSARCKLICMLLLRSLGH